MVVKFVLLVALVYIEEASGHGMMLDPPNRASLWRYDWQQPANYNDNEFFCGGVTVSYIIHTNNINAERKNAFLFVRQSALI